MSTAYADELRAREKLEAVLRKAFATYGVTHVSDSQVRHVVADLRRAGCVIKGPPGTPEEAKRAAGRARKLEEEGLC